MPTAHLWGLGKFHFDPRSTRTKNRERGGRGREIRFHLAQFARTNEKCHPFTQLYTTNLEVVFAVDLNRAGSARVLTRHVPPRTVVSVSDDGSQRPVEAEIGETRDEFVPIESAAEMLVHQSRHWPIEIVPPVAENHRHHRHLRSG